MTVLCSVQTFHICLTVNLCGADLGIDFSVSLCNNKCVKFHINPEYDIFENEKQKAHSGLMAKHA